MAEELKSVNTEYVKCDVCLKEVPKSEAKMAEAQEYVMHFCGLDCYEKWEKNPESKASSQSS
jgi:hypothetical protein